MTPNDALYYPFVEENDIIMGQNGFDVFCNGEWIGTLPELVPGNGYMYFSSSTKAIRFNQMKSNNLKRLSAHIQQNYIDTFVDKHAFPNVMGMIAVLQSQNENNNYSVGVNILNEDLNSNEYTIQVNDENNNCRGVGNCINGRFLITIYGNGGEILTFRAIDSKTNQCFAISENVKFVPDVIGTMNVPVLFTINGLEKSNQTSLESNDMFMQNVDKQIVGCYSISGLFITKYPHSLSNGIFIIKYADGTSEKIIVK